MPFGSHRRDGCRGRFTGLPGKETETQIGDLSKQRKSRQQNHRPQTHCGAKFPTGVHSFEPCAIRKLSMKFTGKFLSRLSEQPTIKSSIRNVRGMNPVMPVHSPEQPCGADKEFTIPVVHYVNRAKRTHAANTYSGAFPAGWFPHRNQPQLKLMNHSMCSPRAKPSPQQQTLRKH